MGPGNSVIPRTYEGAQILLPGGKGASWCHRTRGALGGNSLCCRLEPRTEGRATGAGTGSRLAMQSALDVIVTNLHRNYTGVSATAAAVVRRQAKRYRMLLAGRPLPDCVTPVSLRQAFRCSRNPAQGHRYVLWHVRRNNEIRAALVARDVLRLPVRVIFTSAAQRRHSAVPRWLISQVDAVIATTEAAAAVVPNVHAVVYHGVDTDRFCPAEDRLTAWGLGDYPGRFGIATIGRVRPEKGTDLFVEAMIRLLPLYPDATALIIGKITTTQRSFCTELQRRIDGAGLTNRIIFAGEIAPGQLPQLVRSLSLLVATPRYEGYGMTPLEAMASGVPVIATDAGNFTGFVGANEAGIIVRRPDPEQICTEAQKLFNNPDEMNYKSIQARQRAVNLFGLESEVEGIHRVYKELWT